MYKNKSQLLFRRLCLIVVDIISIILSFFLSAFIAYNGSMELSFLKYTYFFIPILRRKERTWQQLSQPAYQQELLLWCV